MEVRFVHGFILFDLIEILLDMVELTGGNMITCKPIDMGGFYNYSMTLWFKVSDYSAPTNLVELSPVFKLFNEPSNTTNGILSFQTHPSFPKNMTNLWTRKGKWHYLTLSHNGTITMMMDIDLPGNNVTFLAPRRYLLQKPKFTFGDVTPTTNISFGQFILYSIWIEPKELLGEMFNLRDTFLKYNQVLRFFKFERINGNDDNGDILIDVSHYKEHCVLFDPTVWKKDDILGDALDDFLNAMFPPPQYGGWQNSHITFKNNGPVFTGTQAPKRISDYEDGFTIEFWFYFNTKPTSTLDIFSLFNSDSSIYPIKVTMDTHFTLNYFDAIPFTYSSLDSIISSFALQKWYFLSFSVLPSDHNCHLTLYQDNGVPLRASTKISTSTILDIKSFHIMKIMQCNGADCASMNVSLAEIRLWDTYRLVDPVFAFSKVNLTRLYLPSVVSYWRMIYELGNLGTAVYDYSINQNAPYILPTADSYWDQSITKLNVCNHTFRYQNGVCVTDSSYPDDKVIQNMFKFGFDNASFVYMSAASPGFAGLWEWTVDFWMLKDDDALNSILFFIGPLVDRNDYGDNLLQYPTMFTEIRNSTVQTAIDLHCWNFNYHMCQGDLVNGCRDPIDSSLTILNCTNDYPDNNSTALCTNNCLFSKSCENICKLVSGCRSFCNSTGIVAGDTCSAKYEGSVLGQYTCVGGMKCDGLFKSGSNDFYVDCSLARQSCTISIDQSSNTIIPTAENTYSVDKYIKCSNAQMCQVTATFTKDLVVDCRLNIPCIVSITDSDNTKVGSWYTSNIVQATSTQNSIITLTRVGRAVVACDLSLACDVKVINPTNLFQGAVCSIDPIFHKIDVSNNLAGGVTKVKVDQTSSVSKSGFAIVNCQYQTNCQVDIINGPQDCNQLSQTQIIDCQFSNSCTNTIQDTYQIAINCKLSLSCTNKITNSISVPVSTPAIVNFPQIDCTLSTTVCDNTFIGVNVFRVLCNSATSCINKLQGSTSTTTVAHTTTSTYSRIDCSLSIYCSVDLSNGATNLFVNLQSATAAATTPHTITISGGVERWETYGTTSYFIFPVVLAVSSQNLVVDLNGGLDVYVDCTLSTKCTVKLQSTIRNAQKQPSKILCTSSTNCIVNAIANPATNVQCQSSTDCTVLIKNTNTVYTPNVCSTVSPVKTHFNLVDCSNSLGTCTITLDNAKFTYVKCNSANNCIVNLQNNQINPSLPNCGGLPAFSQVDCTSATNCVFNMDQSSPVNTKLICKTQCSNTFTTINAEKSGTFNSKYLYVDCVTTQSCTNTLTDVEEFYIDCTSSSVLCKNVITSPSITSYTQYTDPLHSSFSYVVCSGAASCENTVTLMNPIYIQCSSSTACLNNLGQLTAFMEGSNKVYPIIECLGATATCTNNIINTAAQTFTGAEIFCSSTSTLLCSNKLDYVQEFFINCRSQLCTNVITRSATKVMTYNAASETQYSIIWCPGGLIACTNTLTSVSQVFIYCGVSGSKCTNSFSWTNKVAGDLNFPYVYCKSLTTTGALCKNTFIAFVQVSIDCSFSVSGVCVTTLTNAIDGTQGDSYINYISSTGSKATCTNTPFCFIDCESAFTCTAISQSTDKPTSFPLATVTPILNMRSCTIGCKASCIADTDCLIYAPLSNGGTFLISGGVSSANSYSVIYANTATSPINTCDNSPDCYIYCRNSITACTNTLSNYADSTVTSYSVIDCVSTFTCTNTCLNQIQCYIDCTSAPTCVNKLTNIPTAGLATSLLPTVNCRSSGTCTNTITNSMGSFIDCSLGTGSCSNTITGSLATTSVNHIQCNNGLAGSSCTATITGSSRVLFDCSNSQSCIVTVDSSSWIDIQCGNAISCTVVANNVDWLNVQCGGSVSCDVTSTGTNTNHEVNCNGGQICSFTAINVAGLKFTCENAITSCTVNLQKTTSNEIYLRNAPAPSLSCLVIAAFSYTGTVYQLTAGSFTIPVPQCNSLTSTIGVGATTLTQFSHFSTEYARIITSIVPYKASVILSGGYPSNVNSFTARLTAAQATLTNKPLVRMTKTTIRAPAKISYSSFYPSTVYPYVLAAGDYNIPPYSFGSPPSMSIPGIMIPIVNLPATYGTVTPNLTLPGVCERIIFGKYSVPTPTQFWSYNQKYQHRMDYQINQWNHVALYCKQNDFTLCINGFCRDDNLKYSLISAPNVTLQKEMRFFYDYKGKIGEFKLWKGEYMRTALKYRGRMGPYTANEKSNLITYYRFLERPDTNTNEKFTFYDTSKERDFLQQSPVYIVLHSGFTFAQANLLSPGAYSAPRIDFFVCQDGRYWTGNKGCSSLNAVMKAKDNQASMKLYELDFNQPPEFSISFWYNGDCKTMISDCAIIDGPFTFGIDQMSEIVRSSISGSDITVTLSNQVNRWIQVTQSVWSVGSQAYHRLLVSDREQIVFTPSNPVNGHSTGVPITFSWPTSPNNVIFLGKSPGSTRITTPNLKIKNFMFLKYKLSKNEHLSLPHSEYHHKRAAMFYFNMNDGRFSGITNGLTREDKRISMANSGFIWERDTQVPLLCQENGDSIFDSLTIQCIDKKSLVLYNYPAPNILNLAQPVIQVDNVLNLANPGLLPLSTQFTVSFFAWLDFYQFPLQPSKSFMIVIDSPTSNLQIEVYFQHQKIPPPPAVGGTNYYLLVLHLHALKTTPNTCQQLFPSNSLTTIFEKLGSGWTLVTLYREILTPPYLVQATLKFDKNIVIKCQYNAPTTADLPTYNTLQFFPNIEQTNMQARVRHLRIFQSVVVDTEKQILDRYFDFSHASLTPQKYFTLDNMAGQLYSYDMKSDTKTLISLGTALETNTQSNDDNIDNFYNVYQAVKINSGSNSVINNLVSANQHDHWTLEFMYSTDINPLLATIPIIDINQLVKINFIYSTGNDYFIEIVDYASASVITLNPYELLKPNNLTHIQVSMYNDQVSLTTTVMLKVFINGEYVFNSAQDLNPIQANTPMQLWITDQIYFRFVRLWNCYVKPYPLMQIRNKLVNYFLHRDRLLIYYDISHNYQYLPYRIIWINRQLLASDDISYAEETNYQATASITNIIKNNLCLPNQTYDQAEKICKQEFYLPLSSGYANQIILPLKNGEFSGQTTQNSFVLGFWVLLKEQQAAGHFMRLDFDRDYYVQEDSSLQLNLITLVPAATNLISTDVQRNKYDRKITLRSSWHYFRMTYDSSVTPNALYFHIDTKLQNIFTTIPIDISVNKQFNIELCPLVPGGSSLDCNTVIAHIKIWLKTDRRFLKLCDFRTTLEPNIYVRAYWPLVRNDTDPVGETRDLGPYKFISKINYQNERSNALWVTMSEVSIHEAESLIMCQVATSFDEEQDVLVDKIDDNSIAIYKAADHLRINLTHWDSVEQTVEYTVEFWFKYALSEINIFNYPFNLIIAQHDLNCLAAGQSGFKVTLLPQSNPLYNGRRNGFIEVFEGVQPTIPVSLQSFDYNTNGDYLDNDQWYHFAIVNNHKLQQIEVYVDFKLRTLSPQTLSQLTTCPFYIGDNTGSSTTFFEDTMITVRELRTWNEARTFGQLLFFSNRNLLNDTINVRSYYKLNEFNYNLFESTSNQWLYHDKYTQTIAGKDFIIYTRDKNKFDVNCGPGFVGGLKGCSPASDWIQNSRDPITLIQQPAQVTFDLGSAINDRIQQKDVQITIAIQIKPQYNSAQDNRIFSIQNFLDFRRIGLLFQITMYLVDSSLNDLVKVLNTPAIYPAGMYLYFFIVVDLPNQKLKVINQKEDGTSDIYSYTFEPGISFRTVDPIQFVIIGDETLTVDNYVALSQIQIFSKVLSDIEIKRVANLGIRVLPNLDPQLMIQMNLASNYRFASYPNLLIDQRTFYIQNMENWPKWSENYGTFEVYRDARKIQFCPEGMSLKFNYSPNTQSFSYCLQRSAFTMRAQVSQTLKMQPIKENTRYSWSIRERFRFLNLTNTISNPQVDLIKIKKMCTISAISDNSINITIYSNDGLTNRTISKALTQNLGQNWHELTASLFNFTWTYYLDGFLLVQIPDLMLYYNMSTSLGDEIQIDLSKTSVDTILQVADVAVWGFPFTNQESSLWRASANLNIKQLEGRLLTYYDLSSQPFADQAYDLSKYGKVSQLTPTVTGSVDDQITWSYDINNQIYQPSPSVNTKDYNQNYHHTFSRDKTLKFSNNGGLKITDKLRFDSEFTIELCYYWYSINPIPGNEILSIDSLVNGLPIQMSKLYIDSMNQLVFTPFQINMTNTFQITAGDQKQWKCITAAASFEKSQIYITNFYDLRKEGEKDFNYAQYQSGKPFMTSALTTVDNAVLWLGGSFDGSIRELRIWNTYLSPGLARRFYRSIQLSYHNPLMAGYWPMNDGYGALLKEYIYGNHTIFNNNQYYWVKLTPANDSLEICEGENVFSEGGYCLNREKFLKMRSGYAPLEFTIKNEAGLAQNYTYELMTHSTIMMWICMKSLTNPRVKPSRNLFTLQMSKRYQVNIRSDETLQLDTDAVNPKTIISGVDFSQFYDSWGFISIGCSKLTTYCQVHRGLFKQDYELFKSTIDNNGVVENRMYHNDMFKWGQLKETNIAISGPIEGHIFQLFLKEFQVYQVLLPHQAILLKFKLGITSKLFPALIVHLKMDEFSGTRLYNHAYDTQNSFSYIDVEAVTWHHYQETVPTTSIQFSDPIKYMFCNKENYTYVGDHCEYFQCHSDCSLPGRIGHCTGWTNTECAYIDTKKTSITYDKTYNDYLSCYKHCTDCTTPFVNQNCQSCVTGAVLYNDFKQYYAVANGSCWEFCPISTFEFYTPSGAKTCKDCAAYCFCDGESVSCPGCMNSTFLFDKTKGVCFTECPTKTFYSQFEQTCLPCSENCAKCAGPMVYDCIACEAGLIKFKTTEGIICDNNKCQKGFYYDQSKLSCLKCSEECSECNGPSNLFCIDRCSYSYIKIANSSADKVFKCVSCQDIANDDDKYQSSYNDKNEKCDEVCGDGFNMGINECDDGNKIDKDGCSSNCRVERGYKCRGGSATQKDLCQKILPILGDISMKIESQVNSEKGALKIEFDDKVKLNPIYATTFRDKIKVFLNGTCEKTDLRYIIEIVKDRSGYETLKINYQIDFDIPEDSKCMINTIFLEKGLFIARDGSVVDQREFQSIKLPPFKKQSESQLSIKNAADKLQSIMLTFLIANLVVGFIMGDGMAHMWFLINQLQIVYFIPLINIKFHNFAKFVFQLLAFAIADFFQFIPQYFEVIINLNDLSDQPFNERYSELGIENTYITLGYYQKLAAFLLMLLIYPIMYFGSKIKNKYASMPFKVLFKSMTYGIPLQFYFELYLELSITIWVAILGLNYSNFAQLFSSIIAIIIFWIVTVTPIYSYSKIMDSFDILHDKKFREKFLPLIEATKIKKHSTTSQMWIPIFLFRRFTYAAILCILQSIPLMQVALCIIQSLMSLGYLISVRPFESWDLNFVSIFYESSILVAFSTSILFMHDYNEKEGLIISYILTAVIVVDIGIAMVFLIWDMFKKLKKISQRIVFLFNKFRSSIIQEDKKMKENIEQEQQIVPSESVFATESDMQMRTTEKNFMLSESKFGLIQADRERHLREQEDLETHMEATKGISAQIQSLNSNQQNLKTSEEPSETKKNKRKKKKIMKTDLQSEQEINMKGKKSLIKQIQNNETSTKDIAEILKKYQYTHQEEKQNDNMPQLEMQKDTIDKYLQKKVIQDNQLDVNK